MSTTALDPPSTPLPTATISSLAAGLGVGVFLLAATVAGFLLFRRKQQKATLPSQDGADTWPAKPELQGEGYHVEKPAEATSCHELQQDDMKHELKGDGQVQEVEGNQIATAVHADDAAAANDQIVEKS